MNLVEKILIIDSISSEIDLFQRLFEGSKLRITHIVSGGEGVIKPSTREYSLALIDMRQSVKRGVKAAKELLDKENQPLPLIFILAGDGPEEGILKAFPTATIDFIIAPLKGRLLLKKVENFLALYRCHGRLARSSDELEKFKEAIEMCGEKVIFSNLNGEIEYVNPAFLKLTGYESHEVLGRKTSLLNSGRHDVEFYRSMWETVLAGRVWKGEVVNKKKSGELSCEYMLISPIYTNTKLNGFVALQRDISKERSLSETLMQTEKLSAIGQFASGMAHEINNPLSVILGYADLLLRKKGVSEDITGELSIIHEQAMRSSTLVKNLLNFSRSSPESRVLLDINRVVEESVALYTTRLRLDGIQIEAEYGEGRSSLYADKNRLQQVFVNIINNAHYALTSTKFSSPPVFKVRTGFEGEIVKIVFENNGPPIPKKSLDKIFEPFFTSKGVENGTGLGLSVSSEILREHGGSIKVENLAVESDENWKTGVRFEIKLPVGLPE